MLNRNINKELVEYFKKEKQPAKAKRIEECANIIQWKVFNNSPDYTHKLDSINLCRERLCPNCATARGRKKAVELLQAFQPYFDKGSVSFVTLTTENVSGKELRTTVQKLTKAFKAFVRKLKVKQYFRSTEVTYDENTNTYHPHLHVIMVTDSKIGLKQEVRRVWTECLHKEIHTKHAYVITDVNTEPDEKSVLELCKYITKPMNISQKTIPALNSLRDLQLKRGSRDITSTSKKVTAEYKKEVATETNELMEKFEYSLIQYMWNGENYQRGI